MVNSARGFSLHPSALKGGYLNITFNVTLQLLRLVGQEICSLVLVLHELVSKKSVRCRFSLVVDFEKDLVVEVFT